ncbi:cellulose biosynthesis protein [Bordetella ansorpii]|uniref:Cellulose biosynthesis protein n=1 Tax=Bordetella ansorpii TaxID=288768 RepID=A0A157S8M2_9BORD|nr:cellulose biosynthesis protein BcsQ [Bordetella ansorpii]SAI66778.1 cellulose biosynthesis protein [Bordetella ansorpii]
MKIIAIVSAKGGVGKSTVAANMCIALRQAGRSVLAIDLDPQNALRFHLGGDLTNIGGISRASVGGTSWRDACVQGQSGIYMMPFGLVNEADRQTLERQLVADPLWLKRHLEALNITDDSVVVIDTPPGPSEYLRQSLGIAHLVMAVTLADAASYATIPMIEGLIQSYCANRGDYLGHGYVINQADGSRQLSKDAVRLIRESLRERVIGVIHQDQSVSESLAYGRTVIEHDPHSLGRADLLSCAGWVLQQLRSAGGQPA